MSIPAVPVSPAVLLVADPVEVEVESSAGSPLDDELPVDDSDSAAEAPVGMLLENPVSERGPPQATRMAAKVKHELRRGRMTPVTLAETFPAVMSSVGIRSRLVRWVIIRALVEE
jgi:hypothetical protein